MRMHLLMKMIAFACFTAFGFKLNTVVQKINMEVLVAVWTYKSEIEHLSTSLVCSLLT